MSEKNQSHQKVNHYPYLKVGLGFAFGGFWGGIILSCINLVSTSEDMTLYDISETFFFVSILGLIMGFIPAFLTGVYCLYHKLSIKTWIDYIHVSIVGYILSFIFFFTFNEYFLKGSWLSFQWKDYFYFGFIGGISAMICGKLFLPKLQDLSIQFYQNSSLGDKT